MTGAPTPPRVEVERLLEESLDRRARRLPAREFGLELTLTVVFLAATALLVLLSSDVGGADTIIVATVAAYAIASRVDYPIATGVAVPTQLFLVALFAHADARLVPLLAMGGLMLGTLLTIIRGRSRWDRMVMAGGDATHVLGPAIVFTATGYTDATEAPWLLLVGAFAAQCVVEFLSSLVRDWFVLGVRPRVQALVNLQVWAFDAALTPIAVMAVAVGADASVPWAPLALLPLVALVAYSARDRTDRVDRLHARLEALQLERRRLQVAVRRIGDAFASSLDLDALVLIVTRASSEAVAADGARGSLVEGGQVRPLCETGESGQLARVIADAEAGALLHAGRTNEVRGAAGWALGVTVGPVEDPVAVVAVSRAGSAFAPEERALFEYLAEQASVSAAGVAEHAALQDEAAHAREELEQRVIDRTADLAERTASVEALYAEVQTQALQLRAFSGEQERGLRHLAHEVRGPLYAGDGLVELLLEGLTADGDPQLRADLVSIRGTMHEALRVVDEQLENARLRSGALRQPRFEPVDLTVLFAELSGTFRALHQPRSVAFSMTVAPGTPTIVTDRHFLSQSVRNLLTNASKFTDYGSISVRAALVDADCVQISVQDTGTGIALRDQGRIFDEFTQIEDAQRPGQAGTGIGLALVRELVLSLGGTLALESRVGLGSTFTIALPVRTRSAGSGGQHRSPDPELRGP